MEPHDDLAGPVAYARSWSLSGCRALGPLPEEQARALHEAGEAYVALLGPAGAPNAAVELNGGAGVARVYLLDERRRAHTILRFGRGDGDRLWLERLGLLSYAATDPTGRRPVTREETTFAPDGSWRAEREESGRVERTAGTAPSELLGTLWEEPPAFGDYARISRADRGEPEPVAPPVVGRADLEADVRLWPPAGAALTVRATRLDVDAAGVRLEVEVDAPTFAVVVADGLFNLQPEAVHGDLRRDLRPGTGAHLRLHLRPALAALLAVAVTDVARGLLDSEPVAGVALSATELWYAETVTQDVALPDGMEGSLRSGLTTIWGDGPR